jgi:hypothetical protein
VTQVRDVFYYTDSSIALSWVINDRKKLRMWCHHRVREITNAIRCVTGGVADGPSNLADFVTKPREICCKDIDESSAWQTGLPWMRMPTDQLPRVQIVRPLKEEEVDVFDQEVFHDVFFVREAEDRQLLIGADPTSKSQPPLVHMLTLAHFKEEWLTSWVDFLKLVWRRSLNVVSRACNYLACLPHTVHVKNKTVRVHLHLPSKQRLSMFQ